MTNQDQTYLIKNELNKEKKSNLSTPVYADSTHQASRIGREAMKESETHKTRIPNSQTIHKKTKKKSTKTVGHFQESHLDLSIGSCNMQRRVTIIHS